MIDSRSNISLAEALAASLAAVRPIDDVEAVDIGSALGRVLGEDLVAAFDVPAVASAAVDGYAIAGSSLPRRGSRQFRIGSAVFAGSPVARAIAEDECARIMTGAPLPEGTDTVVMQESAQLDGDSTVNIGSAHEAGEHVRRAGEHIASGAHVLRGGAELSAAGLGVAASVGCAEVSVYRRPVVSCLRSGDEILDVGNRAGEEPPAGIAFDSNGVLAKALASRLQCEWRDAGIVADNPTDLAAALREAAATSDAVITSGGVSVGARDHLLEVIDKLGHVKFAGVRMKPGRPISVGVVADTPVFAMPGNPVAFAVTTMLLALPALRRLTGQHDSPAALPALPAICQSNLGNKPGRAEFPRGRFERVGTELHVIATQQQGSGMLTGMVDSNCLIAIGEADGPVSAGTVVDILPFEHLL